ncbi:MAG: DUF2336 domain-containing protein [Alphaproteobacteria bacterium]|nr:DUF2336 domain-containing protein [Alphaproteobacteria bacterium]MCZ6494724.1 DUF2336 domain-containing protein [Alphaproteobacteria bacterium]MCZ6610637.1 DUF2336 domain-containing protein [Alphaproteobacteria bacterium]MCZ6814830.1 DUF2336 domain-containing protein [Alphaproteobacteria bacterium]
MIVSLTQRDVERLLTDPSVDARADTVRKIAEDFQDQSFSPEQREMALQIFEIMTKDAEIRVRMALSEHLKECPDIPRDIAMALAQDVDAVAVPFLEFSEALSDADLIEIIRSVGDVKQCAVARRPSVSSELAESLVEQGSERVVTTLMNNEGATVTEETLDLALDRYAQSEAVSGAVTRRPGLPVHIAERLVNQVSESLERHLANRQSLSPDLTSDLILQVRERATLGLIDPRFGIGDAEQLVRSLEENGRLTGSIILRALCFGDIGFFEAALARLARVPLANARILVHDANRRGIEGLWDKAGMPKALFPAVVVGIEIVAEMGYDGEAHDRERFRRRMLERVLTQCEGTDPSKPRIDPENLEYLLRKLGDLSGEDTLRRAVN